jgi:hypothetical protein
MLDLNGSTISLSGAAGEFRISAHATGRNRITNGAVIKSGLGYADYSAPFKIDDVRGSAAVIVDNIDFSGTNDLDLANGVFVDVSGQGPGVMHSCTFTGLFWAQEFIHINGWGAGVTTGWTNDTNASLLGSGSIFYFEDNTYSQSSGQLGVSWIQGYYGCRSVHRYNTFNHVTLDMHGTPTNIGARLWEIYQNTHIQTSGSGGSWAYSFRGGSGVIYNNTTALSNANIGLCEEDAGHPADYQIGRGLNNTSDPAYVWNNTGMTLFPDQGDAPEVPGMVQLNRDVFASVKSGYSAYTYPHPDRSLT